MNKYVTAFALSVGAFSSVAADSWDMPTPYGDSTFHTVNIRQFAQDVDTATNGALTITVHSAGSLFPHGEIKNAVRSRQVALGDFFCFVGCVAGPVGPGAQLDAIGTPSGLGGTGLRSPALWLLIDASAAAGLHRVGGP